uniref:Ss18 protein n=1 Tax=Rattus norvegicus TaxID=10116 RepID=B0BN04_RAT|nr:Ss18 protein [Rattus norvegicus]
MHQQPPSQQYSMPPGGAQHYQGQQAPMGLMGQVNQGSHMMGQRQMPPYRPPQQGNSQYGQQQDAYQGPPPQQGYPPQQQQYPGQQGLSILIILRVKVSSMGAIDQHSQDHHSHRSRGLMGTTRDNMEITSSENVLTFQ